MTNEDFKKQLNEARKLYKSKNYEEAVELFNKVYQTDPEEFDFGSKFSYAWAIYRVYADDVSDEALEKCELLTELVNQKNCSFEDSVCVYTITVNKVIKNLSSGGNHEELLFWLDKLKPKYLSDKKFKGYASKRENYYNQKTKCLLSLNRYDEVIELSREALDNLDAPVNEVWFKYRMAQALKKAGDYEEALGISKDLLNYKNDWFIQKDIAELSYILEYNEEALKFAIDACLNKGESSMKVNLYTLLADILYEYDYGDMADKHLQLVYAIRTDKDWPVDESLESYIERIGIPEKSAEEIEKELADFWEDLKFKDQKKLNGTVKTILPHGKAGFISAEDYNDYYFEMRSYNGKRSDLQRGTYVSFYTEKGFDRKKGTETVNAVNIRLNDTF